MTEKEIEVEEIMDDEEDENRERYVNTVKRLASRIMSIAIRYCPLNSERTVKSVLRFTISKVLMDGYYVFSVLTTEEKNIDTSFLFNIQNKDVNIRRKFLVEVVAEIMYLIDGICSSIQSVQAQVNENIPEIKFIFKYKRKEG